MEKILSGFFVGFEGSLWSLREVEIVFIDYEGLCLGNQLCELGFCIFWFFLFCFSVIRCNSIVNVLVYLIGKYRLYRIRGLSLRKGMYYQFKIIGFQKEIDRQKVRCLVNLWEWRREFCYFGKKKIGNLGEFFFLNLMKIGNEVFRKSRIRVRLLTIKYFIRVNIF